MPKNAKALKNDRKYATPSHLGHAESTSTFEAGDMTSEDHSSICAL